MKFSKELWRNEAWLQSLVQQHGHTQSPCLLKGSSFNSGLSMWLSLGISWSLSIYLSIYKNANTRKEWIQPRYLDIVASSLPCRRTFQASALAAPLPQLPWLWQRCHWRARKKSIKVTLSPQQEHNDMLGHTHLIHAVTLSYHCPINCVLQAQQHVLKQSLSLYSAKRHLGLGGSVHIWSNNPKVHVFGHISVDWKYELKWIISYSQEFPPPDILLFEFYHLCLVSQSLGFEPPRETFSRVTIRFSKPSFKQ